MPFQIHAFGCKLPVELSLGIFLTSYGNLEGLID